MAHALSSSTSSARQLHEEIYKVKKQQAALKILPTAVYTQTHRQKKTEDGTEAKRETRDKGSGAAFPRWRANGPEGSTQSRVSHSCAPQVIKTCNHVAEMATVTVTLRRPHLILL